MRARTQLPQLERPPWRASAARTGALLALAACIAILTAAPARAFADEQPTIRAEMSATELRVGERARLTVTVEGSSAARAPSLPQVEGLSIRPAGQQTNMRIVNGDTSVSVEHTFLVEALRPGDYTMPPLRLDVGGTSLATPAIALRVLAAGAPRGAPPPAPPAPGAAAKPGAAATDPTAQVASLEILLPERDLYVGEVVPAQLRLLVREGTRVTGVAQPVVEGKAFSVQRNTEREPQQTTTVAGGARWHVVTFPLAISPLSTGEQPIAARIEMNAIPPRGAGGRGRFGDPRFDSFFGGLTATPQKLEVVAPTRTVRVLPLPDAGRPADFSGGIGHFTIDATADPTELAVGDPVALRVTVSGEGNFDRVALAPVESDAAWRAYPPSAHFEATDELGRAGRKVFEQAIIPQRADLRRVPERRFSYFDPEARRYVTLTTAPIALAIVPGADRAAPAGAAASASPGATARDGGDGFELAPNEVGLGRLVASSAPVARRPAFLLAQALPLAGLVAGLWWVRRRERRLADPAWLRARAARRAARGHVAAMRAAAEAGDRAAFFAAARRAVQEAVAARRGGTAAALTSAEIAAALDGDEPLAAAARELFATADAAAYGGSGDGAGLAHWRARVERLLADLEVPT